MTLTAPPLEPNAVTRRSVRRERTRWRLSGLALVVAVIGLVGVLVLTYPAAAGWFSQYEQSQMIDDYSEEVQEIGPDNLAAELERARQYNSELIGGAEVAANERVPVAEGATADNEYASLLSADDQGLMARLRVPAAGIDLPIYHGTTEETLQKGVGHLEGTALPVGGDDTHAVLTAHRGLASSTLFTNLDQVAEGDEFTIEVFGEVITYRVVSTQVVAPEDTETLYPSAGQDLVTLVTCTPLGVNSHRILVTGERLLPTPPEQVADAGLTPDIPGFPWWVFPVAGAVAVLGLFVWFAGRPPRTRSDPSVLPANGRPTP
ncbi:class C sortase [Microbacterium yannicii]|uniref:class C sortase n=1 Tax=Microbacterium yannicii TaxID=671622 RepID=UPI0002F129D3|nr:class C sortase [Microbacterium yannicii]